ncbi:MAG: hypothetical protein DRH24_01750 [Deltaproteobacteria bacterium]|nr:MAG: hypothetical protein DRH24_01750 [Deltaproteobacteria bacterium]
MGTYRGRLYRAFTTLNRCHLYPVSRLHMIDELIEILLYVPFEVPFNISCHTLRHSTAFHLNDNNVDILVIQSILGHSSTRSAEPYIHPSQDSIRRAMEKLPGIKPVKELLRK